MCPFATTGLAMYFLLQNWTCNYVTWYKVRTNSTDKDSIQTYKFVGMVEKNLLQTKKTGYVGKEKIF